MRPLRFPRNYPGIGPAWDQFRIGYVLESGPTILSGPSPALLQSSEVKRIFLSYAAALRSGGASRDIAADTRGPVVVAFPQLPQQPVDRTGEPCRRE
jgi:hypothetical protein